MYKRMPSSGKKSEKLCKMKMNVYLRLDTLNRVAKTVAL